jgi:diacylglycerol kinase
MREFINAASKRQVENLKYKVMRYSKKAKEAHVLACISIFISAILIIYLILIR